MYGIDIYGEAIDKARSNTLRAGCRINYINKNFFDFEHEYLFDEVITNMPQVTAVKTKGEIRTIYREFFGKISRHLKKEAVLIMYVTEPQFLLESVRENKGYEILEKHTINEKNGTGVFILQKKK